jgi:AhpD family alkylhydroperoxidase
MSTETTARAPRLDYLRLAPDAYRALLALNDAVRRSGLDHPLLELVEIRASQMNGCAFCIDMHTKDARAQGETEQRIYGLSAWRETPFYTARERAALALTEAITLVHDGHVPDDVYGEAAAQFEEAELAGLVWAAVAINAWNRAVIAVRVTPGSYKPGAAR